MKKPEACEAPAALEAPIQLTPDQLETVVAGLKAQLINIGGKGGIGGATTGAIGPREPVLKTF